MTGRVRPAQVASLKVSLHGSLAFTELVTEREGQWARLIPGEQAERRFRDLMDGIIGRRRKEPEISPPGHPD